MTDQEAIAFLSGYAFVAFPSVREWLATTERPNDTVRLWAKALTKCERAECEAVIDAWIDGTIEAPKFLRDGFTLHIRACVMEARRKKLASKPLEEQRKHLSQGQSIMEAINGSELYQREWEPRLAAIKLGEMDEKIALREFKLILDQEFSK